MDCSFQARQEIRNHSTAVRRQAVPDNEQLAGYDTEQLLQEDHYLGAPHGIGKYFEVQLPPAEARNQRQVLPVEVVKQDGRLAARSPSAAAVRFLC